MNNSVDIKSELIKLTESIIDVENKGLIRDDSNLVTDLGFDSIRMLRFIIELEKIFSVTIANDDSDFDFSEYDTISKIVDLISNLKETGEFCLQ